VERGGRVFIIIMVLSCVLVAFPVFIFNAEGASYGSEPILVEGNGEFAAAGFTGNGTADEPYVLSDLNLNASLEFHGIRIANTTAHFRIVGCTVHDAYSPDRDPLNLSASGSGILLFNVTNAIIEDYLGDFNVRGITVVSSSHVLINDSRFNNNIEAGVHLVDCLDGSVKVTNSTFTIGTGDDGILVEGSRSVKAIGNTLSGGDNGIVIRASGSGLGGHLLLENDLSGHSEVGISLGGPSMATGDLVLNNRVHGAGMSGVRISFGTAERVSGNVISGCSQGVEVGWTDNEVSSNILSNNTRGISVVADADRNLIFGNKITDGAFGVLINPSQGNEVLGNTIMRMNKADSSVGIYLGIGEVRDTLIAGNEITGCNVGIRAATVSGQEMSGLSMADNIISSSVREGAYLLYTVESELINNSFLSGGGNGIYLGAGCTDLLLEDNEASYNDGAGLYLRGANDNQVTRNLLVGNLLEGVYLETGSGNSIYGNAFLFNKDSGRQYSPLRPQAYCGEAGNNWSFGTGNLWADWLFPDGNDDGIVDTPYDLSGGYQDPFPLTSISGLEIPADITPPEVVNNSPNGSNAEQREAIRITFSEDMNASSIIVLVNNVTESGTWVDRTFIIDLALEFETDYQVAVMGEDLSGNILEQFGWAFRTEDLNAEVLGRVIDDDGEPLSGVLVTAGMQEALTNVNGNFGLVLSPGDHALNMSKEGYLDKMVMVHVEPGGDMVLEDSVLQEAPEESEWSGSTLMIAGIAATALIVVAFVLIMMRRRG